MEECNIVACISYFLSIARTLEIFSSVKFIENHFMGNILEVPLWKFGNNIFEAQIQTLKLLLLCLVDKKLPCEGQSGINTMLLYGTLVLWYTFS